LVNLRLLPTTVRKLSLLPRLIGKLALPAAVVLLKAALVLVTVFYVLHIKLVQPAALMYTIVSADLTFLLIVCALTRFLGDAGKALAMRIALVPAIDL
jgi:hypothetical protein